MKPSAVVMLAFALVGYTSAVHSQQGLSSLKKKAAAEQTLTPESIVSSLAGDKGSAGGAADAEFFARLKQKHTRGYRPEDRAEVESFSVSRPKISIEVYFDLDSAEITQPARATLDKVGVALQDGRLSGKNLIFRGHTDASGTPNYNDRLSDRRSEAVKRYIVQNFSVDERNIEAIGSGSRNLKNPSDPLADENRRVEIVRAN